MVPRERVVVGSARRSVSAPLALVTGGGGQLAADLVERFAARDWQTVAPTRAELDVTDAAAVEQLVADHRPDVIVNTAAWTDVDGCERDPARAWAVNGGAVATIAEAASRRGSRLVQISTDYVFDGLSVESYAEDAPTGPINVYGETKLAGERAALTVPGALAVRTSWLAGARGHNFVRTMLRVSADGRDLAVVDDQIGCPTVTRDLAQTIVELVADTDAAGVVHATNASVMSWCGLARLVLAAAGRDPDVVRGITTDELDPPRDATRPARSVLANTVLEELGRPMPAVEAGLERLVREILSQG